MGPLRTRARERSVLEVLPVLRSVYQPIVELRSRRIVAVEALVRCPPGLGFDDPRDLFADAAAQGVVRDLDLACRAAAFAGLAGAGLDRRVTLFVNVEPGTLENGDFAFGDASWRSFAGRDGAAPRAMFELTERWFTRRPAELLAAVQQVRLRGLGIALDDVGADVRSLALLPMIAPDVIKLDKDLIQDGPTAHAARTMAAVSAAVEATGAVVLAEGIETPAHLERALAFGATLGQGWLFGRPSTSIAQERVGAPIRLATLPAPPARSPFEALVGRRASHVGTKALLQSLSEHLESQAVQQGAPGVVLSTFQSARWFTARTAERYAQLAAESALVSVFAAGLSNEPAPGVRGTSFGADASGRWSSSVPTSLRRWWRWTSTGWPTLSQAARTSAGSVSSSATTERWSSRRRDR